MINLCLGRAPVIVSAAVILAIWAPPASAYSYRGPRTENTVCKGSDECKLDSSGFAAISLKGDWPPQSATALMTFEPGRPTARGGAVLKSVSLYLYRANGDLKLMVRRTYSAAARIYSIDYPVTDPLAADVRSAGSVKLDLTVYMSQDQAWIESRQGATSLSTVWTVPLFFGFGPETSRGVTITVSSFAPTQRRYYTAAAATLIGDVNQKYADMPDYTPFLFQGRRARAAALAVASVDGGAR